MQTLHQKIITSTRTSDKMHKAKSLSSRANEKNNIAVTKSTLPVAVLPSSK